MNLTIDPVSGDATIHQENGTTVGFTKSQLWGGGNLFVPASPRVLATLDRNGDGTYSFLRRAREKFVFSSAGRLLRQVDLNGYVTTLAYNGSNQLATVTDPASRQFTMSYNAAGRISQVADSGSRSVSYGYDPSGNLTSVTDVTSGITRFTYDASRHLLTMTDPNNGQTVNVYGAGNRIASQRDPALRTTTYGYSGDNYSSIGGTTTITDARGSATLHAYKLGQLSSLTRGYGTPQAATWLYGFDSETSALGSVTDPNGHATSMIYGSAGNVTSRTDALQRQTALTYDALNDLTSTTDPLNVKTTNTYDAQGNLLSTSRPLTGGTQTRVTNYAYGDPAHPGDVTAFTDPNSKVSTLTYDSYGNVKTLTDPLGNRTTFYYDTFGRQTAKVRPKGGSPITPSCGTDSTWCSTYNAFGDLLTTTDALGHQTIRTYDPNRNLKTFRDGNGHLTSYIYDADDGLTTVTRADLTTLRSAYDDAGSLITQTDGANQSTTYTYDALKRVSSMTPPRATPSAPLRTTLYTYDGAGNLKTVKDPSNRTTTFGYDAADQRTSITYSDGITPNVTNITYDADGQRTAATDGTGKSSYVWDSLHRLASSTDGADHTVSYGYDLKGQLTSISYPGVGSQTVTRTYDDSGHLRSVTDWLSHTTQFDYDPNDNIYQASYPGGVTDTHEVDGADRLVKLTDKLGLSTLASFTYTRDNADLVKTLAPTGVPQSNETYGYSNLNQVTNVNAGTYSYDSADNLTGLPTNHNFAYDSANELTNDYGTISFVGGGAAQGAAGPLAVNYSASANDVIVLAISEQAGQGGKPMPTGWTAIGSSPYAGPNGSELRLFWHKATGTESSVQVTFNNSPVHARAAAAVVYRGVDPVSPFDVVGSPRTLASGMGVAAPSVSAALAGEQLVMVDGALGNSLPASWTPPGGMSKRAESPGATMVSLAISDKTLTSAGATGDQNATFNRTGDLVGIQIALKRGSTTYAYDPQGNRSQKSPLGGASTTYAYDQANRLIGIGSSIHYCYNGDGLRMSKTACPSGGAAPFVWDVAEGLPLLLSDGTNNYIYGPGGIPLEQIPITSISFVGGGAAQGAAGPLTVNYSASANDVIVLAISEQAGQQGKPTPTGWTAIGSSPYAGPNGSELRLYWHKATGTESSVQVTFNNSPVHARAAAAVVYRGVDPVSPIDVVGSPRTLASGMGVAAPSVSAALAGEQLVMVDGALGNSLPASWTPPGGMSKRAESPGATMVSLAISDKTLTSAGATGDQNATFNRTGDLVGIQIALKQPPPAVLYFHQDQLGSTRLLTDGVGGVVATYSYDASGNVPPGWKTGTATTPLQFAGEYTDAETGHQYLRSRYYDSATGQFINRDAFAVVTRQPYVYAANDSLNNVDPSGLFCWRLSCLANDLRAAGNAALDAIHLAANAVGAAASLCAIFTSETIVGSVTCGAIALGAGAVSFATGGIRYAEGTESGAGFALDAAGFAFSGLGSIFEAGAQAAREFSSADELFALMRGIDAAEASSWCGRISGSLSSWFWASKASLWSAISIGLSIESRFLGGLSFGTGVFAGKK